ncbi:hypothetical protein J6590_087400 [Homalodisca vitripennis]|nr:hypothetical protein J6590_087400 [Homalodisca vitripennis]
MSILLGNSKSEAEERGQWQSDIIRPQKSEDSESEDIEEVVTLNVEVGIEASAKHLTFLRGNETYVPSEYSRHFPYW